MASSQLVPSKLPVGKPLENPFEKKKKKKKTSEDPKRWSPFAGPFQKTEAAKETLDRLAKIAAEKAEAELRIPILLGGRSTTWRVFHGFSMVFLGFS